MRSSVTISLVPEARGGPFVFWDDLAVGCTRAAQLGFDAVELFLPGPDAVDPKSLRGLLDEHGLRLAAVGTGAGWVKHRLHLTLPDATARRRAIDFIRSMIDVGGPFGAPAIIGSMQGRSGDGVEPGEARELLDEALGELGRHAGGHGVPLLFEPLNRYETNLVTSVATGLEVVEAHPRVQLLCDLFHMNIEEADVAESLMVAGPRLGHVHFVDTNRRAAGMGHLDLRPIVAALHGIGYDGYLSAEVLPLPDSDAAARQTIAAFRYWTAD